MFQIPAWEEEGPNNDAAFSQNNQKKLKSIKNNINKKDSKTNNLKEKPNIPVTNGATKKRKYENKVKQKKKDSEKDIDTDELIINAKRKKFKEIVDNDDKEIQLLFKESSKRKDKLNNNVKNGNKTSGLQNGFKLNEVSTANKKKEAIKAMLEKRSNRNHINTGSTSNKLRLRMLERLKAAQFRYINEKLYTSSGSDAKQLFQSDPAAFQTYHQGYQQQLKKWPVNPLDVIVKKIMKMPKSHTIADLGCGEAALSRRVPHTVRSFDLVATAPGVETCDMAHTPLLAASMDAAVYCLALMGNELTQYLVEANRILKMGGHLLIAEVESRFDKVENFANEVQRLGFKLKQLDKSNQVFFFMEFVKIRDPPVKKCKLPALTLKPCLYKKR